MTEVRLRHRLKEALERSQLDVDVLADRTKVPRGTIRSLMGEEVSAILPERVYLRGQVLLVAKELGLDANDTRDLFDAEHPMEPVRTGDLDHPRFGAGTTVLAASLGGIALLAIVLAFAH